MAQPVSLTRPSFSCCPPLPGLQTAPPPFRVTVPLLPSHKVGFSSKLPKGSPCISTSSQSCKASCLSVLFYRWEN